MNARKSCSTIRLSTAGVFRLCLDAASSLRLTDIFRLRVRTPHRIQIAPICARACDDTFVRLANHLIESILVIANKKVMNDFYDDDDNDDDDASTGDGRKMRDYRWMDAWM